MGTCTFCGQEAGWFKNQHPTCKERHESGWRDMVTAAKQTAITGSKLDLLRADLSKLARSNFHSPEEVKSALIQGWEAALESVLDDKVLSREEEGHLMTYVNHFGLSQADLNAHGAYGRAAMSAVLREVLDGNLPSRVQVDSPLPFNFQKTESLVWVFQNVPYLEERVRRTYVGGSHGVSVRIAKGVYYRIGAFRGQPVETSQMERVDTGLLAITNKHLYFGGSKRSLRIPYSKIVTFTPYSDGLGICRDAATARPQCFITGEGWFIYNLVMNLAKH